MAAITEVRYLCKLRGKVACVYKTETSIEVVRHITASSFANKENFTVSKYSEAKYTSRYFIDEFNLWIDKSQVIILEEIREVETPEEVVPYTKSDNKLKITNDVPVYQLSGATMTIVSDSTLKVLSGSEVSSDGIFTQHRGGKVEVFYRISTGSSEGYWIKATSDVSVIKPITETRTRKIQVLHYSKAAPANSGISTLAEGDEEEDTGDEDDSGDDDWEGEEGVTIGAFYEEPDVEDDEEVVEYESLMDYIKGELTDVAQDAWDNSFIGSSVNNVVNTFQTAQAEVYSGYSLMSIPISRYNYVHGMPFQFTPLTDRRYYNDTVSTDGSSSTDMYGRLFAQTIVADTPIVVFTPGLPRYLTSANTGLSASESDQRSLLSLMDASGGNEDINTLLNSKKNLEYFSLGVTLTEYFKYVNALAQNSARLMGIGQESIYTTKCENIDWGDYNKDVDSASRLADILGIDGGVAFAFDPQSGISHTLANSTTQSSIASQLNTYSAQARELEFIAGASAASSVMNPVKETISGILNAAGGDDEGNNLFSRLATGINNVVQGLNIKFPEIWADSEQQQSYSCEMKFVSPYADEFCCWRYVLVPFFHLLPLAAPRSTKSLNSYTSPFLIRAYSKGYFNVEMGIITSLTYKRFGDGDMITGDGVPSQIDVEVAFQDLYKQLTVATAGGTNVVLFFNNTGLIDLLGTLSGVNMNRLSIADRMSLFFLNEYNWVTSLEGNFRRMITDHFNTFLYKFSPSV